MSTGYGAFAFGRKTPAAIDEAEEASSGMRTCSGRSSAATALRANTQDRTAAAKRTDLTRRRTTRPGGQPGRMRDVTRRTALPTRTFATLLIQIVRCRRDRQLEHRSDVPRPRAVGVERLC